MPIAEKQMFVLTDAFNNNNKFWEATLFENGDCQCRWGRIGTDGQSKTFFGIGVDGVRSKIREKTGKGYRMVSVVDATLNSSVKSVAQRELAGDNPELKVLIKRLAEANRHQILTASGGQMILDLSTGIISTPVGVVTLDSIEEARKLLLKFSVYVKKKDFDNPKYIGSLNDYLMLVPQKVGSSRGWHRDFLTTDISLVKQTNLLDQLESSVEMAVNQIQVAKDKAAGKMVPTFDVTLSVLEDNKVIDSILKLFNSGVNVKHVSRDLKPVRFFEVDIASMSTAFDKDGAKIGNIMRLWHGTRLHNVLSILKSGLIIPKGGSIQINGRMFGDGLYFSDQATKSLNYSYGYWDNDMKDSNCFMFLADVAMGKPHTPIGSRYSSHSFPVSGSDSTFAKAGKSGVMNNEMIVYRPSQAKLRYLVEFS